MREMLIAALMAALASPTLAASCNRPTAPVIPDGGTATDAQMSATPAALDAYIRAMNAYLTCVEQADTAARDEAQRALEAWEAAEQAFRAKN